MSEMLYNRPAMEHYMGQLDGHYKSLNTHIDALKEAAKKLETVAWADDAGQGNESAEAFSKAHAKWDSAVTDTNAQLEKLRDAVDRALGNATHADKQVYNAFQ